MWAGATPRRIRRARHLPVLEPGGSRRARPARRLPAAEPFERPPRPMVRAPGRETTGVPATAAGPDTPRGRVRSTVVVRVARARPDTPRGRVAPRLPPPMVVFRVTPAVPVSRHTMSRPAWRALNKTLQPETRRPTVVFGATGAVLGASARQLPARCSCWIAGRGGSAPGRPRSRQVRRASDSSRSWQICSRNAGRCNRDTQSRRGGQNADIGGSRRVVILCPACVDW
ncbi:Uncharacterised protein [Nocardia otitidiscaviarum]|uniref:Uncharacterized protein n=1 Tax=Nocardia otitidiscaviarum TaxID=1823 RepID=A0A378YDY0_9NOCA|nr:Uncharacterised protein [Nocardia otitidiscaviarum]